jgi:hypothetical protein
VNRTIFRIVCIVGAILVVVSVVAFLLTCGGIIFPFEFAFDLATGWAVFCYRVIPKVRPSGAEIVMAIVCISALAVGVHLFFRWLYTQVTRNGSVNEGPFFVWPIRWTVAILAVVTLMFVAGMSGVGLSKQTAWLATSPELFLSSSYEPGGRVKTQFSLMQLGLAFQNYESANGRLPFSAITDSDDRPLLSWRVAVLPYIEQQRLFNQFHRDEPWDSPNNIRLLSKIPEIYQTVPRWEAKRPYETNFRVFTGKNTAFDGTKRLRLLKDFSGDAERTILIVEAREAVPWTKPDELPYDPQGPLPELGHDYRRYFLALMANGHVAQIDKARSEQDIRSWIVRTIATKADPE